MMDDIKIWEIDGASQAAVSVKATSKVETEKSLEDVLVKNPNMLEPDLTLVGRQTPTDGGGILDMLGVDGDGRLVVFELKREKLTRGAVAQIIDYGSFLESLTETDLAAYITEHSGKNGVDGIDDFGSWYDDRHGAQASSMKPTRMVLVGLGVDAQAHRMVEFLKKNGVDLSLLTFHGFQCGERTLLARQFEGIAETRDAGPGKERSQGDRRRVLAERVRNLDMEDLWQDAASALSVIDGNVRRKGNGITFYHPKIELSGQRVSGSHSVVIEKPGVIRITFFPASVHLRPEEFEARKKEIPFELQKPPNAPTVGEVSKEWYCLLNEEEWKTHKDALTALANDVHETWLKIRRGETVA